MDKENKFVFKAKQMVINKHRITEDEIELMRLGETLHSEEILLA